MTRDEALKKIKKCLSLARSGDTPEAAAALRQAQKLMAEHCVSEKDMTLIDVVEVNVKAASLAGSAWDVALSNLVADAFGCEVFSLLYDRYTPSWSCQRCRDRVFVGTGAAPTVAGYAYEVLSRQCVRARLAHIAKQPKNCKPITKTARGDQFATGWVYGVREMVERFATGDRDQPLLLAYMEAKHPDLKATKPRDTAKGRNVNSGHILAGIDAAATAKLQHGVGGIAKRELLA